jgi:hypothetical protein
MNNPVNINIPGEVEYIIDTLEANGYEAYAVSFEFYGFQSLERGQLEIKTIYMHLTGWGQTVGELL